jgi:UDP-perosamine 4-acetyltransferase
VKLLLVGAGGHARTVVEAIIDNGHAVAAYADPVACDWLDAPQVADDDVAGDDFDGFVMGLGGVAPARLRARLDLFRTYEQRCLDAVTLVHAAAFVAPGAGAADGAMVLPRAAVNPGVAIDAAAIINTGAIVEHDARIGAGAHIAPGAIVLGGARIGDCAMIGAGAVVLPGSDVPAEALVPALGRYPR